jgi:hypothetical protein
MAVELRHFQRAASDVGQNGDNDTLPFDIDIKFINEKTNEIAEIAHTFYERLQALPEDELRGKVRSLEVFFERILVPAGPAGFRISTKIHPFWQVYLNGVAVAIAEANEPLRHESACSYRYVGTGSKLFDQDKSWRNFREQCIRDCEAHDANPVVVQTDITSFYEHIYHHRIKSLIEDLFPQAPGLALQVDRFLGKLSNGRSFGLPVGSQFSRVLAELLLTEVDEMLSDTGIQCRRYVDDFILISESQQHAYRSLAKLSHILADYGLTLNRTKTTFLSGKHFIDYVRTQLGDDEDNSSALREIDLYFDPYSDNPEDDYESLRETVVSLNVQDLLGLELKKAQPDSFVIAQIGRTLKLHEPRVALQLIQTLLSPRNLNGFRASLATIMRGISSVRSDETFSEIFTEIDTALDSIPGSTGHLLAADANCLHYLRALRFVKTQSRGRFVRDLYFSTQSSTVRRACLDCWRNWQDRASFISARNGWSTMDAGQQRMLWLAAGDFGEDGANFRLQERRAAIESWRLGLELAADNLQFGPLYILWCSP